MLKNLEFRGGCQTTAMGIMPHTDVERALKLSLSLDIPFWPQLPHVNYHEDMYAQASQHFPGITVDNENKKISFNSVKFEEQLIEYSERMAEPGFFSLSEDYSVVYHQFLGEDLKKYAAIRGQLIGPVSYGFKVMDENNMPIIYNEQVRAFLFDFLQRKVNAQYHELREKNSNAFVWLDEPGLGWVFSGLSGYSDVRAKQDYGAFLDGLDGPGALHLCANVNLPYLLNLGVTLLSFDAYQMELMPKGYADAVADYITNGGIISWGIVPTDSENLSQHTPETLAILLLSYWKSVSINTKIPVRKIAEQALLAPARCCLKNVGRVGASDDIQGARTPETPLSTTEEQLVEKAFTYLKNLSQILTDRFAL
jgi:hypothetical protein